MRSTNAICPRSERVLKLSFLGSKGTRITACLSRDMSWLWGQQDGGSGGCNWELHCHSRPSIIAQSFHHQTCFFVVVFFLPNCEACRISVPWPEMKPVPPEVEARGLKTGPPGKSHETCFKVIIVSSPCFESFLNQHPLNDSSPCIFQPDTPNHRPEFRWAGRWL